MQSIYITYMYFPQQWLPLPMFVTYRVLIFLYVLGWLLADGIKSTDRFIIFLTQQSYILLTLSFMSLATLTVAYAVCYYSSSAKLQSLFPLPSTTAENEGEELFSFGHDRIRWYVKVSWVLHTTASVLAAGVAFSYWVFLCLPLFREDAHNVTSNLTDNSECQPFPLNLHVHGINAAIVFLDIWMSRIPYQFMHFFYTTPFTTFYLIFSLVYWVANGRTKEGVIYPILDYGATDKQLAIIFALALVFLPMIIYLVLFGIALLRDVAFQLLRRIFFRDFQQKKEYIVLMPSTAMDLDYE